MRELTTEDLISRLTNQFNYPPKGAELMAGKLLACQPQIKTDFVQWWDNGEQSELTVEGYTVQRLQEQHSMNPIAAFLTLDWLLREPKKALASLRKGHDKIITKS